MNSRAIQTNEYSKFPHALSTNNPGKRLVLRSFPAPCCGSLAPRGSPRAVSRSGQRRGTGPQQPCGTRSEGRGRFPARTERTQLRTGTASAHTGAAGPSSRPLSARKRVRGLRGAARRSRLTWVPAVGAAIVTGPGRPLQLQQQRLVVVVVHRPRCPAWSLREARPSRQMRNRSGPGARDAPSPPVSPGASSCRRPGARGPPGPARPGPRAPVRRSCPGPVPGSFPATSRKFCADSSLLRGLYPGGLVRAPPGLPQPQLSLKVSLQSLLGNRTAVVPQIPTEKAPGPPGQHSPSRNCCILECKCGFNFPQEKHRLLIQKNQAMKILTATTAFFDNSGQWKE
ncbi:collagen alpha-1(XVII) chain-like [Motacilla alba alba]|uniref:collagen alpha-1(XVII) chain-like n=1 Tax=Motacilla alba alba TaxID=1094192 RepID=UPI0018D4E8C5|nr:collagen alpha-1(XVII) chain-like [Motacilla alba alba]